MNERSLPQKHNKLRGLKVDGEAFEREMVIRGLEGRDVARLAGVSQDAVTRLRRGQRVERRVLLQIVEALAKAPIHATLERLVGERESRK